MKRRNFILSLFSPVLMKPEFRAYLNTSNFNKVKYYKTLMNDSDNKYSLSDIKEHNTTEQGFNYVVT